MEPIIPAFEVSVFEPALSNVVLEFAELGIDSILEEGFAKSIPIVGMLIGAAKTGQNLHDRNLLRQTLEFIKAFNAGTIDQKKLDAYRKKIKENPKKAEGELGRALILLNQNVDIYKSRILGNLYRHFVLADITWDDFCELSDVTNRMFVSDIELLRKIQSGEITESKMCEGYRVERLSAVGLIDAIQNEIMFSTSGGYTNKKLSLTGLGTKMIGFGMNI